MSEGQEGQQVKVLSEEQQRLDEMSAHIKAVERRNELGTEEYNRQLARESFGKIPFIGRALAWFMGEIGIHQDKYDQAARNSRYKPFYEKQLEQHMKQRRR